MRGLVQSGEGCRGGRSLLAGWRKEGGNQDAEVLVDRVLLPSPASLRRILRDHSEWVEGSLRYTRRGQNG